MKQDPYEAGFAAFHASELPDQYRLREAITAALLADRKRRLSFHLCRWRQSYLLWVGGWERANCGGWELRTKEGKLRDPLPVTVAGRLNLFGWGWNLKAFGTILVYSHCSGLYVSPDGTPGSATRWLWPTRWRR